MLPELGHFALVLALCLAITQSVIPMIGAARAHVRWMSLAKSCAYGQLFFIGFAFFVLAYSFVVNDFSIAYVTANSNRYLPGMYRFAAVWGAHEGSLLLWVFILSVWMAAVSFLSRSLPLETVARVLAVLGIISIGFLLFMLLTSDPFTRLLPSVPFNGRSLNPLLQDPGLVGHPPMLYMGYVGFSVAFAFAIAALIEGRLDSAWARWSRPWTIIAWCFLTLGVTLGSWWSYRELGWGGWWAWDPVENASFMPWLAGTALMHSLAVTEKRNVFKAWTVLLAIMAFSLSLIGTFLVRSGVLISVHAFAIDPARGTYILRFLLIVIGGSLVLYAWRARAIKTSGQFQFWSRETMLLLNNVILIVAMLTVLMGTMYPLFIDALHLGKLSVGPPYFNLVFLPLMVPLFFLMAVAPLFRWRETNVFDVIKRVRLVFVFTIVLTAALLWLFAGSIKPLVFVGLSLSIWIVAVTIQSLFRHDCDGRLKLKRLSRSQLGMILAHLGVAVCLAGIVLTTAYSQERDVRMKPGDSVVVGGYQFHFWGTRELTGPNYTGVEVGIVVKHLGKSVALLKPQMRTYNVQQTSRPKAAIQIGVFQDLYVVLGEPIGDQGDWSMRIYLKRFVRWIWYGGIVMLLGGLLAISDRRYRLKLKEKRQDRKVASKGDQTCLPEEG